MVWLLLTVVTVLTSPLLAGLGRVPLTRRPEMLALMTSGIVVVLPSVLYVSMQAVLTSFFAVRVQAVGSAVGGVLQIALLWLFVDRKSVV